MRIFDKIIFGGSVTGIAPQERRLSRFVRGSGLSTDRIPAPERPAGLDPEAGERLLGLFKSNDWQRRQQSGRNFPTCPDAPDWQSLE